MRSSEPAHAGPLLVSIRDPDTKQLDLWQYLPDLNDLGKVKLAPITVEVAEGDTIVLRNHKTGEYRCARSLPGGLFRAAVSSDGPPMTKDGDATILGDALSVEIYAGALPPQADQGCRVPEAAMPKQVIDTLGYDSLFQGVQHTAGEPLSSLGDGFGLRRQSPELRRFMGLAQLILERGDPVNYAPNVEQRLLTYATGEEVHTRMLVLNTIGDMNVPVATGAAIARAAGFIDLRNKDPRYGKTPNRVLIDTGVLEGVERVHRYQNSHGEDVHMDIENFASISHSVDNFDVPRLSPPFRLVGPSKRLGGMRGTLFPMVNPKGRHGFDTPDPSLSFDLGSFMMSLVGHYIGGGGKELQFEPCMVDSSCPWIQPLPSGQ